MKTSVAVTLGCLVVAVLLYWAGSEVTQRLSSRYGGSISSPDTAKDGIERMRQVLAAIQIEGQPDTWCRKRVRELHRALRRASERDLAMNVLPDGPGRSKAVRAAVEFLKAGLREKWLPPDFAEVVKPVAGGMDGLDCLYARYTTNGLDFELLATPTAFCLLMSYPEDLRPVSVKEFTPEEIAGLPEPERAKARAAIENIGKRSGRFKTGSQLTAIQNRRRDVLMTLAQDVFKEPDIARNHWVFWEVNGCLAAEGCWFWQVYGSEAEKNLYVRAFGVKAWVVDGGVLFRMSRFPDVKGAELWAGRAAVRKDWLRNPVDRKQRNWQGN